MVIAQGDIVLLESGEANLPSQSVVNASHLVTVHKSHLDEYVGTPSRRRVREILDGIELMLEPREPF
jgi:mRNA interferase MazF